MRWLKIFVALLIMCSAGCIQKSSEYTQSFQNITASEAYKLIQNNTNLIIIDVRGCKCTYNKEHIPNAIWDTYPEDFYGTKKDLLIYSQVGSTSMDFCKKLVGHVYGKIYNLKGGIDAWKAAGYQIES